MLKMINLEIVVFANSYKDQGRCIAGKTVNEKKWVRPVSNKNGGEFGLFWPTHQIPHEVWWRTNHKSSKKTPRRRLFGPKPILGNS